MNPSDYWYEAVSESLACNDIKATDTQIRNLAHDMAMSHDCFPMLFPSGPPDRARDPEIEP